MPASLRDTIERLSGSELAAANDAARPLELGGRATDAPPNRQQRRAGERVQQRRRAKVKASYVAQLERHHARNERWLKRHRGRMAERRGGPEPTPPPAIALDTWRACADVMHDVTGAAARVHLSRVPPVWAGAIRRAALGELAGDCARDWASDRARGIVCVGLVLCSSSRRARRKGKYPCIVRGITRGVFAAACKGARTRKPHLNTISGVHRRGAAAESGQIGYLQALQRAGLFYRQQLPASDPSVEPWERWPGRDGVTRTANRYWLVNPIPYDGHLTNDVRAALLELASTALQLEALKLRARARPSSSGPPTPCQPTPAPD